MHSISISIQYNHITPQSQSHHPSIHPQSHAHPSASLGHYLFSDSLGLEDLLDNFLFFNEEGADDAVADTAGAAGTTVGTADGFGVLAQTVVFSGAKSRDLLVGGRGRVVAR